MIEIRLPWPPRSVSPNARSRNHWRGTKAKKRYRRTCYFETLAQMQAGRFRGAAVPGGLALTTGPLRVQLTFVPATRRRRDDDNLVAMMKSGLDGVAEALQVNDNQFRLAAPVISDEVGGFVLVRIEDAQAGKLGPK